MHDGRLHVQTSFSETGESTYRVLALDERTEGVVLAEHSTTEALIGSIPLTDRFRAEVVYGELRILDLADPLLPRSANVAQFPTDELKLFFDAVAAHDGALYIPHGTAVSCQMSAVDLATLPEIGPPKLLYEHPCEETVSRLVAGGLLVEWSLDHAWVRDLPSGDLLVESPLTRLSPDRLGSTVAGSDGYVTVISAENMDHALALYPPTETTDARVVPFPISRSHQWLVELRDGVAYVGSFEDGDVFVRSFDVSHPDEIAPGPMDVRLVPSTPGQPSGVAWPSDARHLVIAGPGPGGSDVHVIPRDARGSIGVFSFYEPGAACL